MPGAILAGRSRVIGPLGRGGMGEVYRLTWHWGRWYAGSTIAVLVVPSGVALLGYYAARGDEPLFGKAFD